MFQRVIAYFKNEIKAIRDGKVLIFLACIALASFLWFLNALEKHYTDHITIPVKYVNLPKNKDLTGKLPEKLDLTVDAFGYTLLQYKLNLAFSPLILDVNELTNNYLENLFLSKYSISTNAFKGQFAKQINSEIEIISIRPDTISFKVSRTIGKMIKVHPVIKATFAREFILQKLPVAKPESILVLGPEEILDTLNEIKTRPLELKNLSQTTVSEAHINLPPELKSEVSKVSVQIAVEQSTEAKFEIPILIINQPDTLLITTFPSKVKVLCKIGISQYNKLNNSSFKAIIDYSRATAILSKLPVILGNPPENILSLDYFPREVDYIIERKKGVK